MSQIETLSASRTRSPAQWFAIVSAVVYLGAGVVGFLVTGFDQVASLTDEKVVLLAVNPLHNVVHLLLGALWLAAAGAHERASRVNVVLGLGLLAAFVLGVAGGAEFLNIDGAAEPDNWLHLVWGAAAIAWGTRLARSR